MKKIIFTICLFTLISVAIYEANARGFDRNDNIEVESILNQNSYQDKISKIENNYKNVIKRIELDKNLSQNMKILLTKQADEKRNLALKYIEDSKFMTERHSVEREKLKLQEIENN